MKKFEVGKIYSFAESPSRAPLECIKVTECFVLLKDIEDGENYKVKKRTRALFLNNEVLEFEQVQIDDHVLRATDED